MVKNIILFLLFTTSVFMLPAQKYQSDFDTADSLGIYEYRLSKDGITKPAKDKVALLKSSDHFSKSNFLNQFKVHLKSGVSNSSALWTLDSIVVRELNESSQQIENNSRQTLATQNGGHMMIVKDYNWVNKDNHWLISGASNYSFSDEGRLDSLEFQKYVTINYRMYTKNYYGYEDGLLIAEWSMEKFDEYDDWEKVSRLEYSYDSISRLKQVNTMEWDYFYYRWSTFEILEYDYDSLGNIGVETAYNYDSYEMVRTKKYEIVYSYNLLNLLDEITEYVEGWGEDNFIPDRKVKYDYDASLNITAETLFIWDYDLNDWLEDTRKQHFSRNSEDQIYETLVQSWDNNWNDVASTKFFAVNSIVPEEVENQEFVYAFLPMLDFYNIVADHIESYSYSDGEWLNSATTSYHFKQNSPVGIYTQDLADVRIFPNPATDYIKIQGAQLQQYECIVYDLSGRMLIHKQGNGDLKLDLSDLNASYYLIEIRKEGKRILMDRFLKY
ncbi:T9SS type A sorting domain-containing protein [uncultured Draconibacterium sp.]|uniref:T9SS type A sorting domain-containing protein n=1 Tax=uncultured Draconibacterium sp. TaxID=1573823 RepID=UPI0029C6E823|nr:T9SS type A sorting domain-containing protein [uncultured Draconibacterium sp.]